MKNSTNEVKEPYYEKCEKCDSDFSCFFRHATKEQKESVIMFAAKEGWREQVRVCKRRLLTPNTK